MIVFGDNHFSFQGPIHSKHLTVLIFVLVQYTLLVVKYGVRMVKSLFKHHCYCPMLLMQTTKTVVCLQTKAICYQLYEFKLVSS